MAVMQFGENNTWININSDLISEYSSIYDTYEIDDEMIEYALDKNERAHMEYNRRTKTLVFIYNVLNLTREENYYDTIPLTFIVRQNQIVTISNEQNEYIIDQIREELEENMHWSVFNFLLHSLFTISENYFPILETLNKEQQKISKLLRKKTTKDNLFRLSDMEIEGMYLVSATKQNAVVLEQLKTQQAFKELDDSEREQLEDNIIEANQLVEMTDLHLQILHQIANTYNNVLNNNLNDTMKFLTGISILMTIPDIVTGFFGMNVQIPFTELRHGWAIILLIIAFGWIGVSQIIKRIMKD